MSSSSGRSASRCCHSRSLPALVVAISSRGTLWPKYGRGRSARGGRRRCRTAGTPTLRRGRQHQDEARAAARARCAVALDLRRRLSARRPRPPGPGVAGAARAGAAAVDAAPRPGRVRAPWRSTALASVAMAEAIEELLPALAAAIKWPNDLAARRPQGRRHPGREQLGRCASRRHRRRRRERRALSPDELAALGARRRACEASSGAARRARRSPASPSSPASTPGSRDPKTRSACAWQARLWGRGQRLRLLDLGGEEEVVVLGADLDGALTRPPRGRLRAHDDHRRAHPVPVACARGSPRTAPGRTARSSSRAGRPPRARDEPIVLPKPRTAPVKTSASTRSYAATVSAPRTTPPSPQRPPITTAASTMSDTVRSNRPGSMYDSRPAYSAPANPAQPAPQRKRQQLGARAVDADRFGGGLVVAHRRPGATGPRVRQPQRRDAREHHQQQRQRIRLGRATVAAQRERTARAAGRRSGRSRRPSSTARARSRRARSRRTRGSRWPGTRRGCECSAGQRRPRSPPRPGPASGRASHGSRRASGSASAEATAAAGQQRRGIAADGEERRVAQVEQPGAEHQAQPDAELTSSSIAVTLARRCQPRSWSRNG